MVGGDCTKQLKVPLFSSKKSSANPGTPTDHKELEIPGKVADLPSMGCLNVALKPR